MKSFFRLGVTCLLVFVFQNCGGFQAATENVPYPYTEPPEFFFDVKLVRMEEDELGRHDYEIDVAVSFATNPDQAVNYRVAFSTLDRTGICESRDHTAIGPDKHARFRCLLPTPDALYIQLTLLGPEGEELVEQYRF